MRDGVEHDACLCFTCDSVRTWCVLWVDTALRTAARVVCPSYLCQVYRCWLRPKAIAARHVFATIVIMNSFLCVPPSSSTAGSSVWLKSVVALKPKASAGVLFYLIVMCACGWGLSWTWMAEESGSNCFISWLLSLVLFTGVLFRSRHRQLVCLIDNT